MEFGTPLSIHFGYKAHRQKDSVDARSNKVGFRDIKITGNQILVNDTPINSLV